MREIFFSKNEQRNVFSFLPQKSSKQRAKLASYERETTRQTTLLLMPEEDHREEKHTHANTNNGYAGVVAANANAVPVLKPCAKFFSIQ